MAPAPNPANATHAGFQTAGSLAHHPQAATGDALHSQAAIVEALHPPATARFAAVVDAHHSPNAYCGSQVVVGRSSISYVDVATFEVGIGGPIMNKGLYSTMLVSVSNPLVLHLDS